MLWRRTACTIGRWVKSITITMENDINNNNNHHQQHLIFNQCPGRLLSGFCIHCWSSPHAGDIKTNLHIFSSFVNIFRCSIARVQTFIVSNLQMPEEESFAVLVRIMADYRFSSSIIILWRLYWRPSSSSSSSSFSLQDERDVQAFNGRAWLVHVPGWKISSKHPNIIISCFQLDTLVQEHIPDLYVHFQSQVSSSSQYWQKNWPSCCCKLYLFFKLSPGDPHKPLREQLVLDPLHHLPLSPDCLQVRTASSSTWSWSLVETWLWS